MKLTIEPAAQADVDSAVDWYDGQSRDLGDRFFLAFKTSTTRIASKPAQYPYFNKRLRRGRILAFPYNVNYSHKDAVVTIIAVLHQHRDLVLLADRLN